jgi:hypothetical protein
LAPSGPRPASPARASATANLKDVLLYVTHGHLFGGIYTWLSQILQERLVRFPPERVAATVNPSLIEFIYWLLGETGEGMGADGLAETIYTDLQKGNTSTARAFIPDLVGTLVDSAAATQDIWEFSGCTCNKREIAEESGRAGGNAKIALQA